MLVRSVGPTPRQLRDRVNAPWPADVCIRVCFPSGITYGGVSAAAIGATGGGRVIAQSRAFTRPIVDGEPCIPSDPDGPWFQVRRR